MNWIKMQHQLHESPEVIGISALTGLDRFAVVGRLHRLWSWFDEWSDNGHVSHVTDVTLDEMTCHAGFAKALRDVGWLGQKEGEVFIPNFDRHNGEGAKKRAQDAERQRRKRTKDKTVAKVVPLAHVPESVVEQEELFASRESRDQRREEKRREIKSTPVAPKGAVRAHELFEIFWELVPTKVSRAEAEKEFMAMAKTYDPEMIVRRTALYIASEQERYNSRKEGETFQSLHPHRWLRKKRFLDEPTTVPVPKEKFLQKAWTKSGRNGSGPGEWLPLAGDKDTIADMADKWEPFRYFVEGTMEIVAALHS